MVTELFDLANAYLDIHRSASDQYCGCNCHKYTCTPNPDTYDCEHCHPDRYSSPANSNADTRPLPRPGSQRQ